jgi:hypothetical protein
VSLLLALTAIVAIAIVGCSKKLTEPVVGGSADGVTAGSAQRLAEFNRVIGVQNAHTRELMTLSGVIGTGTGLNAAGRASILVLSKQPMSARLPREIDGIPVEERVVGVVEAYAKPGGGGTVQCGTSTGNDLECAAGTISCVVLKGGNKYFLSNNHVFARENAAHIGERIDAPGRYDGHPKCAQTPILGNLADFQAISFSGNNTIDCAIASPASGVSFSVAEAGGYTPTSTVVAAFVGIPSGPCCRNSAPRSPRSSPREDRGKPRPRLPCFVASAEAAGRGRARRDHSGARRDGGLPGGAPDASDR